MHEYVRQQVKANSSPSGSGSGKKLKGCFVVALSAVNEEVFNTFGKTTKSNAIIQHLTHAQLYGGIIK